MAFYCNAWNESGHRQIAYLTFALLTSDVQATLMEVIQQHPRFKEDFLNKRPPEFKTWSEMEQSQWLFSQMSVWPDKIRGLQEDSEHQRYVRNKWHYVNVPIDFPTSALFFVSHCNIIS
jgi:hypothetical protein